MTSPSEVVVAMTSVIFDASLSTSVMGTALVRLPGQVHA
jgi:hypothetical protein